MPTSLGQGHTRHEHVEVTPDQSRISPSIHRILEKKLAPVAGRDDSRLGSKKRRIGVQGSGVEVGVQVLESRV